MGVSTACLAVRRYRFARSRKVQPRGTRAPASPVLRCWPRGTARHSALVERAPFPDSHPFCAIDASKGVDMPDSSILRHRRRLLAVGSLLALFCVTGVAAGAGTGASVTAPVLTVGFTQTPISEDPAKDGGGWTTFRTLTNESLIKWSWDGSLQPGLALKWGYFKTSSGPNT